ncbi:MAG: sugar phosphate isomerase/epimerase, partial [Clostridia bacterium]|nr:sugar phosphate isomerase/epimerase [Clostridia bacterium]
MKLSISTYHLEKRFGYRKAFEMIKNAGFDAIDYNLDDRCATAEDFFSTNAFSMSEDELYHYYTEMYEYIRSIGLFVGQTHAVFGTPGYTNHPDLYLQVTRKNILQAHLLHCKHIVIHPFKTGGRIYDAETAECRALNLEFYRSLLPHLEKYDVKIGIENMWVYDSNKEIHASVCSRPEEILFLIEELGDKHFCACPDLGHFALTGNDTNDTVDDALRKLGGTVEIIHAHEVRKHEDTHTVPYTFGTMDWDDIIDALHDIHYGGTLNFEIGPKYFENVPDDQIPNVLCHLASIG